MDSRTQKDTGDVKDGDEEPINSGGLSYLWAAVFVVSNIAGSGILPMSSAISNAGWIGIPLIMITCATAGVLGVILGRCWMLLQQRKPELYAGKCRRPWAAIAFEALGPTARTFVSILNNVGLFGVSVVFMILCADNIASLTYEALPQMNKCLWLLVVAAALWPFTWIGTPKDFWWAGLAALVTTLISLVMIFVQGAIDAPDRRPDLYFNSPTLKSFFTSLPTIMFAFGGASTFPTIQNDMARKSEFAKSVAIAFIGLMLIFVPVGVFGYYTYGSAVDANIFMSLSDGYPKMIGQALISAHVFFAFVLISNPLYQECEDILNVHRKFGWKRLLVRSSLLLLALFIAESVPSFGKILDLVGGCTVSLLTFVLPPFLYMTLADMKGPTWQPTEISLPLRTFLWQTIIIGVSTGALSTYFAIEAIVNDGGLDLPCYIA